MKKHNNNEASPTSNVNNRELQTDMEYDSNSSIYKGRQQADSDSVLKSA